MFNVVLYEPEIPPNTGNIIRQCANTGAALHLIEPLGFEWSDRRLRRAGLDYHEFAQVSLHPSLEAYWEQQDRSRTFAFTTKATTRYTDAAFQSGDSMLFGPETRGLPQAVRDGFDPAKLLRIPMQPESRSMNLANSVAVVVFEAWRQLDFDGAV